MLDSGSKYEIVPLDSPHESERGKILVLDRTAETGEQFLVIAGYLLGLNKEYDDESVLAEIETVPVPQYSELKAIIREKSKGERKKAAITFW